MSPQGSETVRSAVDVGVSKVAGVLQGSTKGDVTSLSYRIFNDDDDELTEMGGLYP